MSNPSKMPLVKKIVATVEEDGTSRLDYIGFQGAECMAASKQYHSLMEQFGIMVDESNTKPKPELLIALQTQQEVTTQQERQEQEES